MRLSSGIVFLAVAACASTTVSAADRTFVSGVGVDSGSCVRQAPCRSFAYALTNTNSGGDIIVLDSAGYGSISINQPVNILSQGNVATVTAASGGTGIRVSTSGVVRLRGLTLAGRNTANVGIDIYNGTVEIDNCVIRDFGVGINSQASFGSAIAVTVSNSRITDNFTGGLKMITSGRFYSGVNGSIRNAEFLRNGFSGSRGAAIAIDGIVDISKTLVSENANGILLNASAGLRVHRAIVSNNDVGVGTCAQTGNSPFNVVLSSSVISANKIGVESSQSLCGTGYATYKDNDIDGNGTDIVYPGTARTKQ